MKDFTLYMSVKQVVQVKYWGESINVGVLGEISMFPRLKYEICMYNPKNAYLTKGPPSPD